MESAGIADNVKDMDGNEQILDSEVDQKLSSSSLLLSSFLSSLLSKSLFSTSLLSKSLSKLLLSKSQRMHNEVTDVSGLEVSDYCCTSSPM